MILKSVLAVIVAGLAVLIFMNEANATMIHDYDYYDNSGILDDVLGKMYIEDERKRTKKVIKTDRKLSKVLVKWETKDWSDKKGNKKVSRKETKIAKTISKMSLVPIVEASTIEVEVPEPSPLLLIGAGLVGLGVSRKFLIK